MHRVPVCVMQPPSKFAVAGICCNENDTGGIGTLSVAITVVPGVIGLSGDVLFVVPFASANEFGPGRCSRRRSS